MAMFRQGVIPSAHAPHLPPPATGLYAMGMVSLDRSDWTVAQLHELPDDGNRYEIIDGVLYVTPSPRAVHQLILVELLCLLRPYAKSVGLGVLLSPADIRFSDRTLVQPDLFAFDAPASFANFSYTDITHLDLAVEVLSPSTAHVDQRNKRPLYQKHGVSEYWMVDVDQRAVERWGPQSADGERVTDVLSWRPRPEFAPLLIDLPSLFREVLGS